MVWMTHYTRCLTCISIPNGRSRTPQGGGVIIVEAIRREAGIYMNSSTGLYYNIGGTCYLLSVFKALARASGSSGWKHFWMRSDACSFLHLNEREIITSDRVSGEHRCPFISVPKFSCLCQIYSDLVLTPIVIWPNHVFASLRSLL